MTWRVAKSLDTILLQVNQKWPARDKSSDGTVASDEHHQQNPSSDHEPDKDGVVCARDITHDPAHGFDSYAFADMLLRNKDDRIKYVISNRRIASGTGQSNQAWVWRPYNGTNPHDHHVHISVKADAAHYDDARLWDIGPLLPSGQTPLPDHPPPLGHPTDPVPPTLRLGSRGDDVRRVQQLLLVDGIFGDLTRIAVTDFQHDHNLNADGIVGPETWQALLKTAPPTPTMPTAGKRMVSITATVFGGSGDLNKSAYTGKVLDDTALYVALPWRFTGERPRVRVINHETKTAAEGAIEDIGPWNDVPGDPYWTTNTRPQAESGTDQRGRKTNLAGIDLSPALAKLVGISGKGLVDWEFTTPITPPPLIKPPASPTAPDWADFDIWAWIKSLFSNQRK